MPGWGWSVVAIVTLCVAAYVAARILLVRWKRARLMRKFDDAQMVDTIMEGRIARGMTLEMVLAVWGEPADLDETVLKTKTKHEMKYDQKGKNRFGTRVYLENGIVVGWETK